MKTAIYGLAWILAAIVAFSTVALIDSLPVTNEGIAAKTYESWSGVLNIWCCGGWQPGDGSFIPWLNKAASRFERRHAGVRVQITRVDESALAGYRLSVNPPDVIVFSPGEIECSGLVELDIPDNLREELRNVGLCESVNRALPIAMGGYAWAINTSFIDEVPYDWSELDDLAPLKKEKRYIVDVPADSAHHCWSGALVALCAPRRVPVTGEADQTSEIDIGLSVESPAPSAEIESRIVVCRLPATLRDDFRTRPSVYTDFTLGRTAAIPVTQREIRNLTRLTQSGKGVSWQIQPGGGSFTDQLLMMAVPDVERTDATARRELSKELTQFMLTDDSQKELASIRAFSVTNVGALYGGQYGMAELEKIVLDTKTIPNAFNAAFRETARREADRLAQINPE